MRRSMRAMLGVLVIVSSCGYGFAEEPPSWWWPFGKWDEPAPGETAPTTKPAPTTVKPDVSEPWRPSMPKFKWPDFSTPSEPRTEPRAQRPRSATHGRPAQMRNRNAWAQPSTGRAEPESPSTSSTWDPLAESARRLGQSTRSAWQKTVDALVPGEPPDAAVTPRVPRVSWWSRMWGAEEPRPAGPRTVTEWMAQDRLDP